MKSPFYIPSASQTRLSYWLTACVVCCILGVAALGLISYTKPIKITGLLTRYAENIVRSPKPFHGLAENGGFVPRDGIIGTTLEVDYYQHLLHFRNMMVDQTQPPVKDTLIRYYTLLGSPDWMGSLLDPKSQRRTDIQQKTRKPKYRSASDEIKGLQHQIEQLESELADARNAWMHSQEKKIKDQHLGRIHALEGELNRFRKQIAEQIQRSDKPVSQSTKFADQGKLSAQIVGSIDSIIQDHAIRIREAGYIQFIRQSGSNKIRDYTLSEDSSLNLWHFQPKESVNLIGLEKRMIQLHSTDNSLVVEAEIQDVAGERIVLTIVKDLQPDDNKIWILENGEVSGGEPYLQSLLSWKGSRRKMFNHQ